MRIHLGGHLGWYDAEKRDWLTVEVAEPVSLSELARMLGVPAAEVAIIAVNRRLAQWEDPPVSDGDLVEFFPPMGGG